MSRHLWGHRIERETRPLAPDAVREAFHPLDHDRNGTKGGSSAQPDSAEIAALRAEYQTKVGRRPWPGWGVAELHARIAKA